MSTNVHIKAERTAYYKDKAGNYIPFTDSIDFNLWQTRTDVSLRINKGLTQQDKINNYCNYILDKGAMETTFLYAEDDYMQEEPIGREEINVSEVHVKELLEWIKNAEDQCYTVVLYLL